MPVKGIPFSIQSSAAQTASGNSAQVNIEDFSSLEIFLDITGVTGTTPSLTVKLQSFDTITSQWYDVPNSSFTAQTAIGLATVSLSNFAGELIRASWAITGTTPSFTFSIDAIGK